MKYRIVVEYEAPPVGDYGFSSVVAQKQCEKALGDYLNQCEAYRISALAKLYSIKTANTVIGSND